MLTFVTGQSKWQLPILLLPVCTICCATHLCGATSMTMDAAATNLFGSIINPVTYCPVEAST
ncbi:hypothetical protein M758_5G065400 [Ceratodon purpureus]|uniref:Uncharacterized protein n=1 Tax=Ceratodon purpureus TaxID=3225 RepID=A0A8T0I120_CERPU|nr:hypothetical protein KC19_5G066300 [Ceratodon purpureus]KAG0576248.1 hypothetical protein KC19_5G066400 [Ceratodon purpureus]KAG0615766.1 hypothetical protein M758_5G065300 [Ceratodon purpureus]KAG0615767.1 hypothetical protein M758_5G065400 [Ceratodon purpureus]